jgi:hypothetical protein
MDTALAALFAIISVLVVFDLAAVLHGTDSRDTSLDDRRR